MRTQPTRAAVILLAAGLAAQDLAPVEGAAAQPLALHARRLVAALEHLGAPLPEAAARALDAALRLDDGAALTRRVQQILDPLCLVGVHVNPESRVKVDPGPAPRQLVENGWRQFLVKVHNEAGVTARLRAQSPQALPLANAPPGDVRDRWLDLQVFEGRPLGARLAGTALEYRIVQLYSRDRGKRAAVLAFDVGQGTQDIGFRADVALTFDCAPATEVTLRVVDENGAPTTAAFEIRDWQRRVYPSQAKRLAPDLAFQPQVYRHDGETVRLPAGTYTVRCSRGPEYLALRKPIRVGAGPAEVSFELQRWVDPAARSWWSGDHHIHAAGCAHYVDPTAGVMPEHMARHCRGEDLKVGCNLTWGPCFDFQKQFFTGTIDAASRPPYLLRYDVEVSGFGSHRTGHLCLLRLRTQIPPGGDSKNHWPTLGLNTLRWAKAQGAVCGPAHSGLGLQVATTDLPNWVVPPFDGIGANEYIVDVTHEVPGPDGQPVPAVDFVSTVDTAPTAELNIWYHTLNCGYRTRISGETDFPCIYGERVGVGRSYVKLDGALDFDAWCEGLRAGRSYVSDGNSHLLDFRVGDVAVGTAGSELRLARPGTVKARVTVAARLAETPDQRLAGQPLPRSLREKPVWHLERARLGATRKVPVELVVNGFAVARREIEADGTARELEFDVSIAHSSWVALRVLPSSHTNPVFVLVDDRPIRASRRSADWCLQGVDQCWRQKQRFYAEAELADAKAAYEHARRAYRRIRAEAVAD